MLDERDLQAIAQIIDSKIQESEQRMTAKIEASEQRMGAKIEESASQTLKEAMQGAAALMESYFEPKFNLLFENQQTMLETLAPKSREDDPHKAAQDELLLLVDEAEQDGGLAKEDGELLRSAIEFTDLCADDILTHRTDLEAVPDTATKEEVARVFSESRYSRILVYSGDIDSIVGVIHQKDFYVGTGVTDKALAQIMTKPLFVANSAKISDLLKLLQRQKAHIAVVTDEYGGTLGIVTMEDILEELVGDIWDEHDEVVESIHKVGEDAYQVLGTADLEDLFEFLCIRDEETESSTVSGWVMEQFGRVPESGERITAGPLDVLVTKVDNHRIEEIQITQHAPAEAPASSAT